MSLPDLSLSNKQLVQQRFGDNAAAYATSAIHAKGWSLGRLVELVEPRPGWRFLDVATGAGHTAFVFAPRVAHVIATDLTRQMLELAAALSVERGIHNVSFAGVDAEGLPFAGQAFDLVTCRIAPHHFSDIDGFVRESARVLKPGGTLAIVDNIVPAHPQAADFINTFERLRDPSHAGCLSAGQWAQSIARAGVALRHTEVARKLVDFDQWVSNQDVPPESRDVLRRMLRRAPPAALEFLNPVYQGEGITFSLMEAIFVGRLL